MKLPVKYLLYMVFYLTMSLAVAVEWRGSVAVEERAFLHTPLVTDQHNQYSSVIINPELYLASDDKRQSFTLTPFYRWDQHDDQRRHADLREAYWLYTGRWYEISLGLRKIFWGSTESQHLVDVINQTDLVENPDGEDKLGQPMLAALLLSEWGNVEIYLLPYFRERTFPGQEGRLRSIPRVDTDEPALYESADKDRHLDMALRWSKTIASWDVGVSWFYGTNREPRLMPGINSSGETVFLPVYDLMTQYGLDIQGAVGAWLWKLEMIQRQAKINDFTALTTGFEYTFYNVMQSRMDIGMVAEYLYDDRGTNSTTAFDNDIMFGIRLTPNDTQSTQFLLGVIADRTTAAKVYRLEASRRLTDNIKFNLESTIFSGIPVSDPLYSYRQDDFIQVDISYFF